MIGLSAVLIAVLITCNNVEGGRLRKARVGKFIVQPCFEILIRPFYYIKQNSCCARLSQSYFVIYVYVVKCPGTVHNSMILVGLILKFSPVGQARPGQTGPFRLYVNTAVNRTLIQTNLTRTCSGMKNLGYIFFISSKEL